MKPVMRIVVLGLGLAIGMLRLPMALGDGVNVQTFNTATSAVYETTESGFLDKGALHLRVPERSVTMGFNYHFADNPLVEYQRGTNDRVSVPVDGIHTLQSSAIYRHDKWAAGFVLQMHESKLDGQSYRFRFGDVRLQGKYQVWRSEDGKTGVVGISDFVLPTGDPALFVSNGGMGAGVRVALEHDFGSFSTAGNLGFAFFSKGIYRDIDYRRQMPYSLAVSVPVHSKVTVNTEFFQSLSFPTSSAQNPGELYLGTKVLLPHDVVGNAGLSVGGTDLLKSNEIRLHLGAKFVLGN